jgi:hypothetical protein
MRSNTHNIMPIHIMARRISTSVLEIALMTAYGSRGETPAHCPGHPPLQQLGSQRKTLSPRLYPHICLARGLFSLRRA